MDTFVKNIGILLREEREKRNLDIDDFSKLIGMWPHVYVSVERGHRRLKLETYFEIFRKLGYSDFGMTVK